LSPPLLQSLVLILSLGAHIGITILLYFPPRYLFPSPHQDDLWLPRLYILLPSSIPHRVSYAPPPSDSPPLLHAKRVAFSRFFGDPFPDLALPLFSSRVHFIEMRFRQELIRDRPLIFCFYATVLAIEFACFCILSVLVTPSPFPHPCN